MILEIAQIDVKAGRESQFEKGVRDAIPLFKAAKGCRGLELRRSIENPRRYRALIRWETVENHTVDFRGSEDFKKWRALVGECFDGAPQVEHVTLAFKGF